MLSVRFFNYVEERNKERRELRAYTLDQCFLFSMTLSLGVHSQFSSTFPDNEADEDKGLRGPWLSVVGETSTGKKKT